LNLNLVKIIKWIYGASQGVMGGIGFLFVFLFSLVALSHDSLTLVIKGEGGWASASMDKFTSGSNGVVMIVVLLIFVIGSLITLGFYIKRSISNIIKRRKDGLKEAPVTNSAEEAK
jgi:hypothetical protein